jgi:hypothetical protein
MPGSTAAEVFWRGLEIEHRPRSPCARRRRPRLRSRWRVPAQRQPSSAVEGARPFATSRTPSRPTTPYSAITSSMDVGESRTRQAGGETRPVGKKGTRSTVASTPRAEARFGLLSPSTRARTILASQPTATKRRDDGGLTDAAFSPRRPTSWACTPVGSRNVLCDVGLNSSRRRRVSMIPAIQVWSDDRPSSVMT